MEGSFSGYTGVHNINIRIIFFINWCRRFLGKSKFSNHIPQGPISPGGSYSINKICFHGTQRIDRLSFRPVNNCTPGKCKVKYNSGSPLGRIIYICIIQKTHQVSLINVLLRFGDMFVPYNWIAFGFYKIQSGYSSLVTNTPLSVNTQISINVLQETVAIFRRSGREFRQYGDAITNIWYTGNITIHYFSKHCSSIETILFLEVLMLLSAFFWYIMNEQLFE